MDDTWQYCCRKDYGIDSIDKWAVDSFMELYKTVLFKFGHLIGKWSIVSMYPYGGLLSVEVDQGRFVCYQCHAPIDNCITNPFIKKELFEVIVENKKCVRNCLSGTSVHPLEKLIYLDGQLPRFSFECVQRTYHPKFSEVNSEEYQQSDEEESSVFDQEQISEKNVECERLQWPDPVSTESLMPTPGLYKGTYGSHGVEIIMVHISSDQIIGTKITGDPNIPATKITFKANISQVVTHSEINELYSSPLEENQNEVAVTEFRLPDGYDSEYDAFPNEVRTRYNVNTV
ncbi:Hypothetical predicted protein [Paramuricea clavata]|nr:Hypothetical predicted protein [Paramuricea clavata]